MYPIINHYTVQNIKCACIISVYNDVHQIYYYAGVLGVGLHNSRNVTLCGHSVCRDTCWLLWWALLFYCPRVFYTLYQLKLTFVNLYTPDNKFNRVN